VNGQQALASERSDELRLHVVLLYTLPIFLSTVRDGKDFALNAFAVTFIVELDNLSGKYQCTPGKYEDKQLTSSASEIPLLA